MRFAGTPRPPMPGGDLPPWWPELPDAKTVVVVTQGTLANEDRTALLEPAMRALADLDALVIVTTGGSGAPFAEVPDNVRVTTFVPFDLLLPRADVLVTNGGYGGVLKALSHGVPLIVAGDSEDKPAIALRVEWSGTGINLHTGHPTADAIRAAVIRVRDEPSFRDAAARLQSQLADLDPADALEAAIAELT
ncbi:glycosyltransferase [Dactylosporangium sp. CA-092794]|uniref:glycosyltransferase n=1 Tax=Dactylosporangium sp. CA-092794 TaxID=3239929 RepID=UPI003D8B6C47